jgi:hypothetical protein
MASKAVAADLSFFSYHKALPAAAADAQAH